jgi:hypothetical protein
MTYTMSEKAALIRGLENIAEALGYRAGDARTRSKQAYRLLRRFSIPFAKEGRHIVVSKQDVTRYRRLVIGKKSIAMFLGVDIKTLNRWLRLNHRFRHMFSGDKTLYIDRIVLWLWALRKRPRETSLSCSALWHGTIRRRAKHARQEATQQEADEAVDSFMTSL